MGEDAARPDLLRRSSMSNFTATSGSQNT